MHRLRDLSRRDQAVAALLAVAMVVAPLAALAVLLPVWRPTGDTAYMALRTLEVGTGRTPTLGQPSSSGIYTGQEHVHHLGATHFYVMAPFVRTLGPAAGMLTVSVLTTVAASWITVWTVFRRLGRQAGILAAVGLTAVLFGMGAGGMLNPISSNHAGLPLFASTVLVWAVACGDDRLLPLAAGTLTYTAHQHLSVMPSVVLLTAVMVVAVVVRWWRAGLRHDREVQRHARRWGLTALGVTFVLWLPQLLQQIFGFEAPRNLTALVDYVQDGGEEGRQGLRTATKQLGHTLGYPPVFTRTELTGFDLLRPPSTASWVTAGIVAGVVAAAGSYWWRTGDPRRSLAPVAGLLAVIGLVSGSSVPLGPEQGRLAFYHWIWPLSFFVLLVLMFLAGDLLRLLRSRLPERWPLEQPVRLLAFAGSLLVVVGMVTVALVSPQMDRPANQIKAMAAHYPRDVFEELAEQVTADPARLPEGPTLLVSEGEGIFEGVLTGLTLILEEKGFEVLLEDWHTSYAHDDRIVRDLADVDAVLVLAVQRHDERRVEVPGERLAAYEFENVDQESLDILAAQFREAERVVPSPQLESWLLGQGEDQARWVHGRLENLTLLPEIVLRDGEYLDLLLDFPPLEPEIDREALERLRASVTELEDAGVMGSALAMEVYLVSDPRQLWPSKLARRWEDRTPATS